MNLRINSHILQSIAGILIFFISTFTSSENTFAQEISILNKPAAQDLLSLKIRVSDGKYLLSFPQRLLNREILVVTRINKSGPNVALLNLGNSGDKVNEIVIVFDKDRNNNLLIRHSPVAVYTNPSLENSMRKSLNNSATLPIVASFKPRASDSREMGAAEYDFTDFFSGDNIVLGINSQLKSDLRLGSYQPDKSEILSVENYSDNLEAKATKTFLKSDGKGFGTMELVSTFILLPAVSMKARDMNPLVGYKTTSVLDYDLNSQSVTTRQLITRWRLEPRPEDLKDYRKGKLVIPAKPIVFYIDPATPPKWIPYLMKGVSDWQTAFEQAGFKNAIYAEMAPSDSNSDWSIGSSRFSTIVYVASENEDASYSTVVDPRSGEILQSHIRWYHGVMNLKRDQYFVEASPNDKRARKMIFEDELMGELIRNVCSHEIGHALGFPHNFGASSTVPIHLLRDKNWVAANGHTPSIMDYSRFNYVAQPEDHIPVKGLLKQIGAYDKWAIKWGYRLVSDEKHEIDTLNKWIRLNKDNPMSWFSNGDRYPNYDPRSQSGDLSNDVVLACEYGINNLARVTPNLVKWTKQTDGGYQDLNRMFDKVVQQYLNYLSYASANIGGVYEDACVPGDTCIVYSLVPIDIQEKSLKFLKDHAFKTPKWLIDRNILNRINANDVKIMDKIYSQVILSLLAPEKLVRLRDASNKQSLSVDSLFNYLRQIIFPDKKENRDDIDYTNLLQEVYIDRLEKLLGMPERTIILNPEYFNIPAIARHELETIKNILIKQRGSVQEDFHYNNLIHRITTMTK